MKRNCVVQPAPTAKLPKANHNEREYGCQTNDRDHDRSDWILASEIGDASLRIFDPGIDKAPCGECEAYHQSTRQYSRLIPGTVPGNVKDGIASANQTPNWLNHGVDVFRVPKCAASTDTILPDGDCRLPVSLLGINPEKSWLTSRGRITRDASARRAVGSCAAAWEAAARWVNTARREPPRRQGRKSKPGLPDLDHSKAVVLESLRSSESKLGYRHAIDEFIQSYCSEPRLSFSKVVVTRFRIALENRGVAAGTIHG